MRFKAVSCPQKDLALTNHLYCSPADSKSCSPADPDAFFLEVCGFVFSVRPHADVKAGELAFNQVQRKICVLSLNADFGAELFVPPKDGFLSSDLGIAIDFPNKSSATSDPLDAVQFSDHFKKTMGGQVFTKGQELIVDFVGRALKITIDEISVHKLGALVSEEHDADATTSSQRGQLIKETAIMASKAGGSAVNLVNVQKSQTPSKIFRPDFSFESMGIGGLDKEFSDIFRRAFASRVFPASAMKEMGINHVRGMILYGAPGCGKTLIARQIGKMLNGREPKVVNGPEVLNKYVGASEENIRKLFADAEAEYAERGDESELHIIIFDELDAICRQRGSRGGDTGVGDQIVNQLLSKIDGVNSLNNVLLIGMTNRKDLLDEALLRPGRLEVHCEIGLPDEKGRIQILRIHTSKMRDSNRLGPDVDIAELAKLTKNFTGAEIEGLTKSSVSFALERNLDGANLSKPLSVEKMVVTWPDWLSALSEVKPAFGASAMDFEMAIPNGIIKYGMRFDVLSQTCKQLVEQIRSSPNTPIMSVLLEGPVASGKTAFAASLAMAAGFPFVKLVTADMLVGYSENQKAAKIQKVFDDAHRSALSMVVLDDLERLIEYVRIGPRFSNVVLQTLLVLVKKPPPKGRKLLVVATTACPNVMESMELLTAFQVTLNVPNLDTDDATSVISNLKLMSAADVKTVAAELGRIEGGVGIKRLLMVLEMAKQGEDQVPASRFLECLHNAGL